MACQGLLLLLRRFKVLVMMTSLQNVVILAAEGFLMFDVDGSKFLIKMTSPQNIDPLRPKRHYINATIVAL